MKVTIRPLKEEDAYTSVKWRNDPEVFKYTGNVYDREITIQDELSWIRRAMQAKDECRCAILADGRYVGNIYLTGIRDGVATLHVFIGEKDCWGKGVARQAFALILRHAFGALGLDAVLASVRLKNERSMKLFTNFGFDEVSRDAEWAHLKITKDCINGGGGTP